MLGTWKNYTFTFLSPVVRSDCVMMSQSVQSVFFKIDSLNRYDFLQLVLVINTRVTGISPFINSLHFEIVKRFEENPINII